MQNPYLFPNHVHSSISVISLSSVWVLPLWLLLWYKSRKCSLSKDWKASNPCFGSSLQVLHYWHGFYVLDIVMFDIDRSDKN